MNTTPLQHVTYKMTHTAKYDALQKPDLIVLCKSRGIKANTSLNKPDLIARLLADDNLVRKPAPAPAPAPKPVKKPIVISTDEELVFGEEPVKEAPVAHVAPVVKTDTTSVSGGSSDGFVKKKKTPMDFVMNLPLPRGTSTEWHLLRMLYSIHPDRFQFANPGHKSGRDDSSHVTLRVDTTKENTGKSHKPWAFWCDYHIYYTTTPDGSKQIYTMVTTMDLMSGSPRVICTFGH